MKKPSTKSRRRNRIHAAKLNARRLVSKRKKKILLRSLHGRRPREVRVIGDERYDRPIACPADFSLETNFDEVVGVLHGIRSASRRQRNERTYIDFANIRRLSPTAALVLAAELDRWNHIRVGGRLRPVDLPSWDPNVRCQLRDMGFFELLATTPQSDLFGDDVDPDTRYVMFRTGNLADGEAIHQLREVDLEPVVGAVPRRRQLYGAVTEAMTNVVQHAYTGTVRQPNWWLSASYNAAAKRVTIMIYDQGQGIPKTLPARLDERLLATFGRDHARMIQAAHELSRSASAKPYRGQGLRRDVRGYLNGIRGGARYRVISLKGEYIYEVGPDGKTTQRLTTHQKSLYGTLIVWDVSTQ